MSDTTGQDIDRAAMNATYPGVPPAREVDYLVVDYLAEAKRQANQAQRDYRRARTMSRTAEEMDRVAANQAGLADWWTLRVDTDPDAREQAERCRDNADAARRLAQSQRDHAPQWRAYARQAASLARRYEGMAETQARRTSRTAR